LLPATWWEEKKRVQALYAAELVASLGYGNQLYLVQFKSFLRRLGVGLHRAGNAFRIEGVAPGAH
jgi:hypothetical protein